MRHGRSTHQRLVAVLASFALVAGLGVALTGGTSSAQVTYGPNLLDNSGFGQGTTGWARPRHQAIEMRTVSPGAVGSAHALRLVSTKRHNVRLDDAPTQYPRATGGVQYLASAHVQAVAPAVTGEIRIREHSGDRVLKTVRTTFRLTGTGWQQVAVNHTARATGSRLQVSVIFPELRPGAAVRIDRVWLREVKPAKPGDVVTTPPVDSQDPDDQRSPAPTTEPTKEPTTEPTTEPTKEPTKEPTTEPTKEPTGTLFGASVYQENLTWTDALARSNQRYGGMDVVRVFYSGMPSAWPGRAGEVGGPVVVSFKAHPADILAGKHDDALRKWFAGAPRDREVWWVYYHEPEDNVERGEFTHQQWRDAFRRIAGFADAVDNPRLHNTIVLMCWTVNPKSGRSFANYFPGRDVVEAIGWDCYSHPSDPTTYAKPADMYARAIATSKELGVPWGIAETGSRLVSGDESGDKRAVWLRQVGRYLADNGATFVTYFDSIVGGEFRLLDTPSQQAWREVVTTY